MVFERIFKTEWLVKSPAYFLFLGVVITLISFFISFILFHYESVQSFIGISTVMFIVVIAMPTLEKLFEYDKQLANKKNISFFDENRVTINFFVYFFIGVFMTFFILALLFPGKVFSERQFYGMPDQPELERDKFSLPPPPVALMVQVGSVFINNIYVAFIAFFLSFAFGAGVLFLISLNSSLFAVAITELIQNKIGITKGFIPTFSYISCNLGVMLSHTIPELAGYFLAAIAGGNMSELMLAEKAESRSGYVIIRNSLILIILSVAILFLAALSETGFSQKMFQSNLCFGQTALTLIIFAAVLAAVLVYDHFNTARKIRLANFETNKHNKKKIKK